MSDVEEQNVNHISGDDSISEQAQVAQAESEELAVLRSQVQEWQSKADEWLDQYRRVLAEFANYRKRQERDREQQRVAIKIDVLKRLLPIVDDFELALSHVPADLDSTGWAAGVALILRKMQAILSEYGIEPIDALGKLFDPNYHEAMLQEVSDEYAAGTVMEEMRKGYQIDGQVIRATQVKVSSGPQ
jgi:molecular chaperone GrpE